jgi:hypothetical protein
VVRQLSSPGERKTRNGPSNAGDSDHAKSVHGLACTARRMLWALIMHVRWSHDVSYLLLNAPDEHQKNELTRPWQKNKLADLKRIGITRQ